MGSHRTGRALAGFSVDFQRALKPTTAKQQSDELILSARLLVVVIISV